MKLHTRNSYKKVRQNCNSFESRRSNQNHQFDINYDGRIHGALSKAVLMSSNIAHKYTYI